MSRGFLRGFDAVLTSVDSSWPFVELATGLSSQADNLSFKALILPDLSSEAKMPKNIIPAIMINAMPKYRLILVISDINRCKKLVSDCCISPTPELLNSLLWTLSSTAEPTNLVMTNMIPIIDRVRATFLSPRWRLGDMKIMPRALINAMPANM